MKFTLEADYVPTEDQSLAAQKLVGGVEDGQKFQTLLGVTGSGKTFTMATAIERLQRPALIISHNKTLAWQLYQEFKQFFPKNEVHYFVSYYDYYQPEAYLPSTDTYIEKDAKINDVIDRLRHSATQAILTKDDVIVVASVSCIYNIGDPVSYKEAAKNISVHSTITRQEFLRDLVKLRYARNDFAREPGTFEVKGESVYIYAPTGDSFVKVTFNADVIDSIEHSISGNQTDISLFPAKHFVNKYEDLSSPILNIERELAERLSYFDSQGKVLEAARLEQRTRYDIELLRETGYVSGIENYSRHLSGRPAGSPPDTLLDYFSLTHKKFLVFVDESHMTIPQIRGMYNGDRSRKEVLIEHGFRLPSALDNRPLMFDEWYSSVQQGIFVSATPGDYEYKESQGHVAEQLLRPTHILDPEIEIRPTEKQVEDLLYEIRERVKKGERALVTVITKRLAEDLAEHLERAGIKAAYLHADIHTLDRPEVLNSLRRGNVDVLVGINLLREGLDLPEVSLVAILDADKEGFLRNETTLIQTMGRAARHPQGRVIMYADHTTDSMKNALKETERRREYQRSYNKEHGLTAQPVKKREAPAAQATKEESPEKKVLSSLSKKDLKRELRTAVDEWDFERAIIIRDILGSQ